MVDLEMGLFVPAPVGVIGLSAVDDGLARLTIMRSPSHRQLALCTREQSMILDQAKEELNAYFEGKLKVFQTPISPSIYNGKSAFSKAVLQSLAEVPYGQTTTYGALAARCGKPKAGRAVGSILENNPVAIMLPCHRVVASGGGLGGFMGGRDSLSLALKNKLLRLEGITTWEDA